MWKQMLGALAGFFIGMSAASANLVVNGDFETGNFGGWTVFTTGNGTVSGSPGTPNVTSFNVTGSGSSLAARFGVGAVIAVGQQEGGGIFQVFSFGGGGIEISADIAVFLAFGDANDEGGVFSLLLDGAIVDSHAFGFLGGPGTLRDSLSFSGVASAGNHELRILITRPFTAPVRISQLVDNISVAAPIPEPEIYAMMLAGLGVVGWMSRRRRSDLGERS